MKDVRMKIFWGCDSVAEATTLEQFDSILDALAAKAQGRGMIVQAAHDTGRTLALGLGRAESFLTFFDNTGASYTSVGDREREDYLTFEFGGDVSEILAAKALPEGVARAAARDFFETGSQPRGIEWEREWA